MELGMLKFGGFNGILFYIFKLLWESLFSFINKRWSKN